MFELRISEIHSSFKKTQRTREQSPFVVEVLAQVAKLAEGQAVYVSHKAWLESLDGKAITPASEKNGPRYTLQRYLGKGSCIAGNLSGSDLEAQAESEGRELTEYDTIYRIAKGT